ncbi:F510_1955 family glycosylhydrolase [Exiguobacterium sp. NPDC077395]|uniref:F510_1955 family glycosylhydrolase n=1 Tax=Exiguobacterium sp. NPDC077395 TaxID=3390563 RepID=UPI003CFDC21A
MKRTLMLSLALTPLLLSACGAEEAPSDTNQSESATTDAWQRVEGDEMVSHIHGAGFWQDDERPVIATHAGLMEYREDGWYTLPTNRHDYMGFEVIEDGFYASGHPDRRTDFKNPLGVLHGKDHGAMLEARSLEGEADFHYMSAGYETGTLYVYLEEATSQLETGFHRSTDGGRTFEPMQVQGIEETQVAGIVADATDAERVFLYGPSGILVSNDSGDSFEPLIESEQVVTVGADDGQLAYIRQTDGSFEGVRFNLDDESTETFNLPELQANAVPIELAIKEERMLLVTSDNSVYEFTDGEWEMRLDKGELN